MTEQVSNEMQVCEHEWEEGHRKAKENMKLFMAVAGDLWIRSLVRMDPLDCTI